MMFGYRHAKARNPRDFYRTPQTCIDLMPAPEGHTILDAGAGDGRISAGFSNAVGIDIYPKALHVVRCDFFGWDEPVGSVVMNPPYKLGEAFVWHALFLAKHAVIALLPWPWLNPQCRAGLRPYCYEVHPLGRVSFDGQSPAWDSAWFVFRPETNPQAPVLLWPKALRSRGA